jgi:hypothetical protein
MSASPFRSHLLQQWAKSNQQRPPAAVVPWLKPKRQQPLVKEEEDSSSRRRQRHGRRHHHHHHHGSSPLHAPPSLSSVDSAAFSSSWKSTVSRDNSSSHSRQTTRFFEASSAARKSPDGDDDQVLELKNDEIESNNNSAEEDGMNDDDDDEEDSFSSSIPSTLLQSFLLHRRTVTRLTHRFENREAEQQLLRAALDRAVECAQMAPNHKRTEPFSFRRFLAGSLAAQQLAEISYQVTLLSNSSVSSAPNAEAKRKKWLEIPAFLVTLVHENQSSSVCTTSTPYEPLPYTPPETERQLEDVSTNNYCSTCTLSRIMRWSLFLTFYRFLL